MEGENHLKVVRDFQVVRSLSLHLFTRLDYTMLPTTLARTTRNSLSTSQLRSLSFKSTSSSSSRHLSFLSALSASTLPPLKQYSRIDSDTLVLNPLKASFFNSRRYNSSSSSSSSSTLPPPSPPPNLSLTQRLKLLFKTHGWTALTLYLVLSFIDFSLTFLLVWSIGADRVREFEDWVLMHLGWRRGKHVTEDGDKGVLRRKVENWKEKHGNPEKNLNPVKEVREVRDGEPVELGGTTTMTTGKKNGYSAYATTAVLAYAIHKTALLPVRVGLTVWSTPKVVRLLQSWGYVPNLNLSPFSKNKLTN